MATGFLQSIEKYFQSNKCRSIIASTVSFKELSFIFTEFQLTRISSENKDKVDTKANLTSRPTSVTNLNLSK